MPWCLRTRVLLCRANKRLVGCIEEGLSSAWIEPATQSGLVRKTSTKPPPPSRQPLRLLEQNSWKYPVTIFYLVKHDAMIKGFLIRKGLGRKKAKRFKFQSKGWSSFRGRAGSDQLGGRALLKTKTLPRKQCGASVRYVCSCTKKYIFMSIIALRCAVCRKDKLK